MVIPPLRERREDLPALCTALLARIAHESGISIPPLTPQALQAIASYPLHGNVRELENLLHRAVALSDGDELQVDTAPPEHGAAQSPAAARTAYAPAPSPTTGGEFTDDLPSDLQAWLDQQERDILVRALREAGFNRTATAARLGISLRQIRYRIARLSIAAPNDLESPVDLEG